jgi:arylsulfatase A-like enzyme
MSLHRRGLLSLLAAISLAPFVPPAPAVAQRQERTNFIVVFIDDMGYGDLSCYGNTRVKTPNIDRLAEEGIRFTEFYANAPICSPSRVALTTGQYPARWGITSFLASRKENQNRGIRDWLAPEAPTLARLLQKAGYATGHFGKWHMGGQRDVGDAPPISAYGFDTSLTQFEGLGDRVLALFDTQFANNGGKMPLGVGSEKLGGKGKITWVKRYDVTKTFTERAMDFIKEAKKAKRPFYVNVWPDDVHSPHEAPPDLRGDGSKAKTYDGVIANMDRQLGALFDFIRNDPELSKNTLVLLASDNGPEPGSGSAGPFRGTKGRLYEGGIREPFISWSPELVSHRQKGSTNSRTVLASVDIAPSILKLAGVPIPADITFDGGDYSDALTGQGQPSRNRPLIWVRPPDHPGPVNNPLPDVAVRDGKWKLLQQTDGSRAQLYDISADPGEKNNVAEQERETVAKLQEIWKAFQKTLPPTPAVKVSQAGKHEAD